MKKEDLKHQIFTIPNILTYLRILAIPVYMVFTINKATYTEIGAYAFPIIGLAVMIAAASTDLIDGFIARRFNQVTDLGKMLDPLADKLMHTMAVLALVIAGLIHWAFIVVLLVKEATMVVGGIFMANNSKLIQANKIGKVASATISLGVFMSYFHAFFQDKVFYLDWIVLGIGVVLTYIAFFNYLKQAIVIIKRILADKREQKGKHIGIEDN